MCSVTAIYVLTNMAYFSVLTPEELIASDAVALSFAQRALGPLQYVIPVAVALSCMGTVNSDFLTNSRLGDSSSPHSISHSEYIQCMLHVCKETVLIAGTSTLAVATDKSHKCSASSTPLDSHLSLLSHSWFVDLSQGHLSYVPVFDIG